MSKTCIGKIKGTDKVCGHKAQPRSKFCKVHDESYKNFKKAQKEETKEKNNAAIQHMVRKFNSKTYEQGLKEDELLKQIKWYQEGVCDTYYNGCARHITKTLALKGIDMKGCPNHMCSFSRKIWMVISWHLIDDLSSYQNLAMSCKAIRKVLVDDKVAFYEHPFQRIFRSPKLFFFPIFRVLMLDIPDNFDEVLADQEMPSIQEMVDVLTSEYGVANSPHEALKRRSKAMLEAIEYIVSKELGPKGKIVETVKDCGLFIDLSDGAVPTFHELQFRTKTVVLGEITYVIADAPNDTKTMKLIAGALVPFKNNRLYRLAKVTM